MNKKDVCRRHFKNLGYRGKYNRKILDYIGYEFDLFSKNNETLAVYTLNKESSFASLVDAARIICGEKTGLKICLCAPEDFSLPINVQHKAFDYNIDLYIIKENHVELIQKGLSKKEFEKLSLVEIQKILLNINRICKNRWGFDLFKIRKSLLKNLSPLAQNNKEFLYQIATMSSIIESVNLKDIKAFVKPRSRADKKTFADSNSIEIIKLFFKKNNIKYDSSLIINMKDIRSLRNLPPIHPARKLKPIFKKFVPRVPRTDSDWSEISKIVFRKFKGSLILLRDTLK